MTAKQKKQLALALGLAVATGLIIKKDYLQVDASTGAMTAVRKPYLMYLIGRATNKAQPIPKGQPAGAFANQSYVGQIPGF